MAGQSDVRSRGYLGAGVHSDGAATAEEALESWLAATEASDFATLRRFAGGIRRNYAAVKATLNMSYSDEVVEGNVNRLKYLKRQMYGRANFDLLRKPVLYAP